MYSLCGFLVCLIPFAWAAPDDEQSSAVRLATRIDQHLVVAWQQARIEPASQCDDATFLRRVSLDLVGRIPTVAETRSFLADNHPQKRLHRVSQLVNSRAYAAHWATFWRRTWIPQADTPQFQGLASEIEHWVESELQQATPYDQIVTKLLLASRSDKPGAANESVAFLSANEFKPENLAANTTRAFLGINLDCAQCHDHPFSTWRQEQFWETAAFFARPTATGPQQSLQLQLRILNTERTVAPKLLTEPQPNWPVEIADDTGRAVLASWVTARNNPYFAKNAVNRVWAVLLGSGIVEPLDDLGGDNPASHPELLDDLARAFADSGFDLRYLTTAIILSRPYQLSSIPANGAAIAEARSFSHSPVRGLTGEQLYDSLRIAAGLPLEREDLDATQALRDRRKFIEKFRIERSGTAQRSILQALSLMNGKLTTDLTDVATTPTLRAAATSPFLNPQGKVELLFLTALGRSPSNDESTSLVQYLETEGTASSQQQRLTDIFWALINCSEFNTNH